MHQLTLNLDDLTHWKKFLYLPVFLFQPFHLEQVSCREEYRRRLNTLATDDWNSITLGSLKKRVIHSGNQRTSPNFTAVTKLVSQGLYRKAVNTLNRTPHPNTAADDIYQRLERKFPASLPSTLTAEQHDALNSYQSEDKTVIDPLQLRRIITHMRNGVKNGMDKLRYEHLHSLVGLKPEPAADELEFCTLLATICSVLANGDEPATVSVFLSDSELIGIPKGDQDVRPIGIGSALRKIVSKYLIQHNQHALKHCFPNQHGMDISGTERIIHDFNHTTDTHPDWDTFAMDALNAFNSCNRYLGLHQLLLKAPGIFKHVMNMYGHPPTHNWFFGKPHGIDNIEAHSGFTQGDTLATLMYCMSIQPFVDGLTSILTNSQGIARFYIDDGNICAPHDVMIRALNYVVEEGPKYGYELNLRKGSYLVGQCRSNSIATHRKNYLVSHFNLDPSIIHLHPSNGVDFVEQVQLTYQYGVKMLGSYIGHRSYITHQLDGLYIEHCTAADNLTQYDNLQCKTLLLRSSFSMKIHHLMRTTSPEIIGPYVHSFSKLQRQVFTSIFNEEEELSDIQWELAQFPVHLGGCGIVNVEHALHASYCASFISWYKSSDTDSNHIEEWLNNRGIINNTTSHSVVSFLNCIDKFSTPNITSLHDLLALQPSSGETLQSTLTNYVVTARHASFMSNILNTDTRMHAWILSGADTEAGQWLLSKPNRAQSTFTNSDFAICVRLRLYMHQPSIVRGTLCTCKYTNTREFQHVDDQGIHPTFGCTMGGGRIATHDNVTDELCRLIKYCGYGAKREEIDCFRAAFPDNSQRPDITMQNPRRCQARPFDKLILDIGITCPVPPASRSNITVEQSKVQSRAADRYYVDKNRKYSGITTANELSFLPLIFESTGRMHKSTKDFFKTLAHSVQELRGITDTTLYSYFIKSMSCTFQKSVAEAFKTRVTAINRSKNCARSAVESDDFVIRDGHEVVR